MHNGGFFVRISKNINNDYCKNLFMDSLPNEYGEKVVSSSNNNLNWYFFDSEEKNCPAVNYYYDDGKVLSLLTGVIYNADSFEENINELKKVLLDYSEINISECIRKFSGTFCGFVYDYKNNIGIAFTDKTGVNKLFYYTDNEEKIFSTNLFLVKEYLKEKAKISRLAFSSIIYCNWTYNDESIIENVKQILPAHFIKIENDKLSSCDYAFYPKRKYLDLKDSVKMISDSHKDFWKRLSKYTRDDIAMLVSKGKDSRVILKHMIDSGLSPFLLSFYRKNENIKPFVTFLTNFDDDSFAVENYAKNCNLEFERLKIENKYLLENLFEIINLNNGTPLHWEFLAASEYISKKYKYIVTGYDGHILAGRNEHRDYFSNKIKNYKDYSDFKFNEAGYKEFYNESKKLTKEYNIADLCEVDELEEKWFKQYESINSDDLDVISVEGQIRTRGIGRESGTFYQARKYTVQLYPYLDNEIFNAYLSIPSKYLKWEIAHLKQFSDDKRFNDFSTSKINISASAEARYIWYVGYLRKLYKLKKRLQKRDKLDDNKSALYADALKDELLKFNDIPNEFVKVLFAKSNNNFGYYQTIANLLTALRVKDAFFNMSTNISKRNLKFVEYKKEIAE
jgi:hypothetical protein